jgi:hypothetical protein
VLWIDPPSDRPPVPIRERVEHPEAAMGRPISPSPPACARATSRSIRLPYSSRRQRHSLAEVDQGPIMIARESDGGKSRMVVMGFDPFAGAMRYELATPLLLANVLRWVAPGRFREVDVGTQSAGPVAMPSPRIERRQFRQVLTDNGTNLPFNVRDRVRAVFRRRIRAVCASSRAIPSASIR